MITCYSYPTIRLDILRHIVLGNIVGEFRGKLIGIVLLLRC